METNRDDIELTFDYTSSLTNISDDNIEKMLQINSSNLDMPWIVSEILYGVSDNNPNLRIYNDEQIKELVDLLVNIYDSSWDAYFDISSGDIDLEKISNYTKQDRYMIEAANGLRVATEKEIKEGIYEVVGNTIIQLINKPTIELDKSEYIFFNTFAWAMLGRWRYYIKAGYKCEYIDNKLKEPEINYIYRNKAILNRMCELLRDENYYNNLINKMLSIKKAGKYKYPAYAEDEIEPTEKFIFIHSRINKEFPKVKSDTVYEAYRIMQKHRHLGSTYDKLTVDEKLAIRKAYCEIKYGKSQEEKEIDQNRVQEIKELCDEIRKGVGEGILKTSDFSVKVVTTISKSGYKNCSIKQRQILNEAINKISSQRKTSKTEETKDNNIIVVEDEPENETDDKSDVFSIAGMSDLLGKGMLFDE